MKLCEKVKAGSTSAPGELVFIQTFHGRLGKTVKTIGNNSKNHTNDNSSHLESQRG